MGSISSPTPFAIIEGVVDNAFTFGGGTYVFPGADGTCSKQLEPGQSCTVEFSFAPKAVNAYKSAFDVFYAGRANCLAVGGGAGGLPSPPLIGGLLTGSGD